MYENWLGEDSALVILGEWWSYKGGCLSRFDCIYIKRSKYSSAKYYQNKERLQKKIKKDIKLFLIKKKKKAAICLYKNLPEDEKQRLVEYRKNIVK